MMMRALLEHLEATAEDIVFSADLHAQDRDGQGQRTSNFRGATLPAQLRRLTTLETSSSSEIWSFLLMAQRYTTSANILLFLIERIRMSSSKASSFLEGKDMTPAVDHEKGSGSDLLSARHVYGPDAYRMSTLDTLEGMKLFDPSAALACHLLRKGIEKGEGCGVAAMSTLSVRLAVMLFLDVWLASFAEDFLPRNVVNDNSNDNDEDGNCDKYSTRRYEVLDLLISLMLEISSCDELLLLGLDIASEHLLSPTTSASTGGPCCHDNLQDRPFKSFFPTLYSFLRFHSFSQVEQCPTMSDPVETQDNVHRSDFSVDMLSALAKLSMTQRPSCFSSSSKHPLLVSESVDSVIMPSSIVEQGSLVALRQQFLLQLDRSLLTPLRVNVDTYAMLAATLSIAEISSFTIDVETSAETAHGIRRVFSQPIDKMYIQLPEHLQSTVYDSNFLLDTVVLVDNTSSLDSCAEEKLLNSESLVGDGDKDSMLSNHLQYTDDDIERLPSSDVPLDRTAGEILLEKNCEKNSDVFVDFLSSEVTDSYDCGKIFTGKDNEILNDEEAASSSRHVNSAKLQKLLGCTEDDLMALVNKEHHEQEHNVVNTAKIQQILGCSIDQLSVSSRNSLDVRSSRNTDVLSAAIKQTSVFSGIFGGASRRITNLEEAKSPVITEKSIKEMEVFQKGILISKFNG
jgi:hypothetical protein